MEEGRTVKVDRGSVVLLDLDPTLGHEGLVLYLGLARAGSAGRGRRTSLHEINDPGVLRNQLIPLSKSSPRKREE